MGANVTVTWNKTTYFSGFENGSKNNWDNVSRPTHLNKIFNITGQVIFRCFNAEMLNCIP